ncbi:MAG TPA: asparaginase [Gemmatimonadales bacterium]|nr:asparaginase [Gemmatimonadales bacterium]
MIHLLFTGGTISMHRDPAAGGNVPTHGGEALVGFAAGLDRISPYRIENWAMLPACHLGPDRLWALRERVRQVAESGEVRGIVIAHGTDTIEETAYLLDRTLDPMVPVAITGAMRTSSDPGWDGPRNLIDATAVAASEQSIGRGVMVVFHGQVFAGRTAVKTHATDLDAFAAPHSEPLGQVDNGCVKYSRQRAGEAARQFTPLHPRGLSARIALVPMVVGDKGDMLDLARPGHDGVVVVAFGSGNVPPGAVAAIGRWLDEGKPVVLATRCPNGTVSPVYAFEGGGARLVGMGAIPAGPRALSQARMELMIAVSAGTAYGS